MRSLSPSFLGALAILSCAAGASKVSFDGRSFSVDGQRKLFIAGSVHYPRAPRSEWASILQEAKNNGLNMIQTYVFWDIHEPQNNQWNFPSSPTSNNDLVAFVQEAAKLDLYVHLRIAGYICAEWNFGGLPGWLRNSNSTLRTYDAEWMKELSEFVEKTVSVVKDAGLLAGDGGPIVMLQIENEYGNMESNYGEDGHKYVQWLSDYALQLDVGGLPWVMCQQGEGVGTAPAAAVVNACNGFYCDNWISLHAAAFPDQPHMWTENWPGWFQNWGEPVPHRPAVDVSFAVARWFARGGSYMNYYMAFGGTTFGRSVGGPLIVTSYDYDVQINEFALRAEPKFTLLQQLHGLLADHADVLLAHLPPAAVAISSSCESHTYTLGDKCVAFLSNWGEQSSCAFPVPGAAGQTFSVAPWSVTIATGANCSVAAYNTKTSADAIKPNAKVATAVPSFSIQGISAFAEPVPSSARTTDVPVVTSQWPREQLSVTGDATDYLWYSTTLPGSYDAPTNVSLQFSSGTAGGGVFYVYVNGVKVASTLGAAGGPPVVAESAAAQRRTTVGWEATNQIDKSTVAVGAAPLQDVFAVSLTVPVPAGSGAQLDILSVSMGLKNYGPFLELVQVGVASNITVDGVVLSGFTHSVGLLGEAYHIANLGAHKRSVPLEASACAGLCWYSGSFFTPPSVRADTHLALDLSSSMGKGAVWVNGHMLGRYWNITAAATKTQRDCDACASAEFVGAYNGDRCRSGCGAPSQQLYKLPAEWLHATGGERNSLVLFEELGGAPADIRLVQVSMA